MSEPAYLSFSFGDRVMAYAASSWARRVDAIETASRPASEHLLRASSGERPGDAAARLREVAPVVHSSRRGHNRDVVKRGMSGKGRGGAPPLPRQRGALRVVQLTLAMLALFLFNLAYNSYAAGAVDWAEVAVLLLAGATAAGSALWMGIRTVRGPQPPSLD